MTVPPGIIVIWSGAIVDIPAGWALCDGTNGTPNLRDRFVVGAGTTYNPGDIGGSTQHQHTFTGNGHTHDLVVGAGIAAGAVFNAVTAIGFTTGTTAHAPSLPPYYALAFIMKT